MGKNHTTVNDHFKAVYTQRSINEKGFFRKPFSSLSSSVLDWIIRVRSKTTRQKQMHSVHDTVWGLNPLNFWVLYRIVRFHLFMQICAFRSSIHTSLYQKGLFSWKCPNCQREQGDRKFYLGMECRVCEHRKCSAKKGPNILTLANLCSSRPSINHMEGRSPCRCAWNNYESM